MRLAGSNQVRVGLRRSKFVTRRYRPEDEGEQQMMHVAPLIIAIDGFGAAGKTTLAEALSAELENCPVTCLDDFCYPPSGRQGEWWGDNVEGYGVDVQRCRDQVLLPASRAQAFRYQRLDWNDFSLQWTSPIEPTAQFLIVEGTHSLRKELRDFYKVKVWLDSPSDSQLERIATRDGEHMLQHWINEFLPAAQRYQRDHDPRSCADIILQLGDGPEPILRLLRNVQG